jgi:flagellin
MVVNTRLRSQLTAIGQATRNVQDAVGVLQTADGGLGEIHSALSRLRELAMAAANTGALGGNEIAAIVDEAAELAGRADDVATTTRYGERELLDGTYTGQMILVGDDGASALSVTIGNATLSGLGIAGMDITSSVAALSSLENALETVTRYRAEVGALLGRLDATMNVLQSSIESLTLAASRSEDADVAQEAAQLRRDRIGTIAASRVLSAGRRHGQSVIDGLL